MTTLNPKIKTAIKVLKHRNLLATTSKAELARISGVSRTTIERTYTTIEQYKENAPEPTAEEIQQIDKKITLL